MVEGVSQTKNINNYIMDLRKRLAFVGGSYLEASEESFCGFTVGRYEVDLQKTAISIPTILFPNLGVF